MSHAPDSSDGQADKSPKDTSISRPATSGQRSDESRTYTSSTYDFETEFQSHQAAVKESNFEKAIQSFVMLQTNSSDNSVFQKYVLTIADHIDPSKDTHMTRFFASLPALIQSTIVESATGYLEEADTFRAFHVLFDYIQAYPRHAYKYLIRSIKLLILCAQAMKPDASKKCIKLLVTELLPRLWKQRVMLARGDKQPSIKSTDSKHYIVISYKLFEQYMLVGQQYYIEQREWEELTKFTCAMLDCSGYARLGRLCFQSHINRFQYLKKQRSNIRLDLEDSDPDSPPPDGPHYYEELHVAVGFMCEFMAVAAQFVEFSHEYYRAVCGLDDNAPNKDEKTCLIPVCAIQPSLSPNRTNTSNDHKSEESKPVNSLVGGDKSTETASAADKNRIQDEDEKSEDDLNKRKKAKVEPAADRGEGLDSYCMRGVDEALQILSKAADCLRHIVDLWEWASVAAPNTNWANVYGSWEQEFSKTIESYQLPFDIHNAVLLVRSDLALSSPSVPGNLAKALKLSQTICDRIELQRRREKKECASELEFEIPFMFAFRVLYNIGVIYLLQSTLEIAIILSVFPTPNGLDENDFIADEKDCYTAATIFQGHEFGMMRVTQEGLMVRCIKHLIVSLDSESGQKGGMASIDSAMRWDEKAGHMIVLMQYGWPYWSTRTNFWQKIIQRMQEKRIFKNRGFLEYVYVPEILQAIQNLHETNAVTLDIIPPEFAMRNNYLHLASSSVPSSPQPSSPPTESGSTQEDDRSTASMSISTRQPHPPPPPPLYQPSFTNTILPSMSMSPSWYSASTQKNSHANWMSPSFYYSRPATSVVLPKKRRIGEHGQEDRPDQQSQRSFVSKDIISRCLEYRMHRYSPKMTPQHMRRVLQKFLKNMVLKANEDV
ncbi:hypothetical protein CLU79DRAFT_82986 [Phycomyces nitens]|nr:hypothetical protein CLU79DRAFT_82986 [Phycomyces nitens]